MYTLSICMPLEARSQCVCVCFVWLAFVFSRTSHQQNDCVVESFLACQAFANSFASNYTFTNILYNLWILILLASLRADKLNLSSFVLAAILLCWLIFSLLFGMEVFWCVCVCANVSGFFHVMSNDIASVNYFNAL